MKSSALPAEAFHTFQSWFKEANSHKDIKEANAVNLATACRDGMPSNRMVLLKDYDEEGFVFYTNRNSYKGWQLRENPFASLCFYWEPLAKQVRIEGFVADVDVEEADEYFASRPLKSRIGAWASSQSQPLDSQATLMKEIVKQTVRFATQNVPRPEHWSGFRLVPCYVEFWQKGDFRIHQRRSYVLNEEDHWETHLLYP